MEMTLASVASGYFQMATARGFIVTDPAKLPTSRLLVTYRISVSALADLPLTA
jgi:hypothetical protein